MMEKYEVNIIELKERIFYMGSLEEIINLENPFFNITEKDLTILMTPLSNFKDINVDLPKEDYYNSIINYLRNGESPAIILSDYNIDRLMIETMRGGPKSPRIFIQSGTEIHKGIGYYKDPKILSELVDRINPRSLKIGGALLQETEQELINWDLSKFSWEQSANSGCFVGSIYLLFRDKYPTRIDEKLVLRD